ncbi:hypothetical protein Tco_0477855 [Tanacetum coccineum]
MEVTTLEANLRNNGTTLDASSVTKGTTLEGCLVIKGATLEACLVTEGAELDASLVTKDIAIDDNFVPKESIDDSVTLLEQLDESSSSGNETDAMLKFEKQTVSKLELKQDDWFQSFEQSYEENINRIARNRLSKEFEPLVKDVNLQLNYFEKGLVKEMKDDLKYVTSLEDEFDEKCLILDIQKEFFKTQFDSVKPESHSHVYENEIFEQDSSLENDNCCLKKTIYELSKQADDVKDEMTKRCAQYEKDFAKPEAHCISLELKSQNEYLTSMQNGHVLKEQSD